MCYSQHVAHPAQDARLWHRARAAGPRCPRARAAGERPRKRPCGASDTQCVCGELACAAPPTAERDAGRTSGVHSVGRGRGRRQICGAGTAGARTLPLLQTGGARAAQHALARSTSARYFARCCCCGDPGVATAATPDAAAIPAATAFSFAAEPPPLSSAPSLEYVAMPPTATARETTPTDTLFGMLGGKAKGGRVRMRMAHTAAERRAAAAARAHYGVRSSVTQDCWVWHARRAALQFHEQHEHINTTVRRREHALLADKPVRLRRFRNRTVEQSSSAGAAQLMPRHRPQPAHARNNVVSAECNDASAQRSVAPGCHCPQACSRTRLAPRTSPPCTLRAPRQPRKSAAPRVRSRTMDEAFAAAAVAVRGIPCVLRARGA